jgi:superfamily I DNA/RNA helicase/mRNA-degrading endonuclease RelE of RelBE toxin-antitoxin system
MSYELTFTRGFKSGLEVLPREIYPIVDRQLKLIEADPFANNPNAKKLKNMRNRFRVRIGIHVRLLYQVYSKQQRVELFSIGPRDKIYDERNGSHTPLTPAEADAIRAEIQVANSKSEISREIDERVAPRARVVDLPITVEVIEWITEDELFLLQVPSEWCPNILSAGSIEGLLASNVEASIKSLIEDYWTNPQPTQIEKLYSLSAGQGSEVIAQHPLSNFLIALDPEQRQALQKIKSDGPYLLKGSAGTGKSLVGLYHIRDLIASRAGESLFDEEERLFGVITYTNTLVDTNQILMQSITPASAHAGLRCSTLDKIAYDLAKNALGGAPNPLSIEGVAKWLRERIIPTLAAKTVDLVERLGSDYVANEIEQVIIGNGLELLEEYLKQERSGRKRGLREVERRHIWAVYENFRSVAQVHKVQTFEQLRVIALNYLKAKPDYPRFSVLFVDEAQDFSKVARKLCLTLVGQPRHLLLAADTGQSIYTVPSSWIQSDPRLNFQRRKPIMLERSYRATREIGQAIAPLRMDIGDEDDRSTNARPVFSGPRPRWIEVPLDNHVGEVCNEISRLVNEDNNPINPGQIAIILRDSTSANRYLSALQDRNIEVALVDKNTPLRLSEHHVHIVTAHSSKGLGFPVVFVPEVHESVYPWRYLMGRAKDEQQSEQIKDAEQRLLYVALSRASHRLYMVVDTEKPSPFLVNLDRSAHWS